MADDYDQTILTIRFNQDQSKFICGMESGFRIYHIDPLVEQAHHRAKKIGSIALCEMIKNTNYICIVAGGSHPKCWDNHLLIFDDILKKPALHIPFYDPIKAVRWGANKLIVAVMRSIYIYSFPNPTPAKFLMEYETMPNNFGLCEITPLITAERKLVIFPGGKVGSIQMVDLTSLENQASTAPVTIPAHKTELRCLAINKQGTRVATASTKGTLIRVWDTFNRDLLVELRRGTDIATIYCINFSLDAEYLCCSSDKGTVHIFAIKDTNLNKRMMLPNVGIKYMESQWAPMSFTVPPESACICAFAPDNCVIALCLNGTFHKYSYASGTCTREAFDVFVDMCDCDIYYFSD